MKLYSTSCQRKANASALAVIATVLYMYDAIAGCCDAADSEDYLGGKKMMNCSVFTLRQTSVAEMKSAGTEGADILDAKSQADRASRQGSPSRLTFSAAA